MRNKILVLHLLFIVGVGTQTSFCQENLEDHIRKMDDLMRQAWIRGDTIELMEKYWSPNLVVHNPLNKVVTVDVIKRIAKGGRMTPISAERTIEKITIVDNIAIAMGEETAVPSKMNENAGKKIISRFTNVWMKTAVGWRMIARQSTIVKVEEI